MKKVSIQIVVTLMLISCLLITQVQPIHAANQYEVKAYQKQEVTVVGHAPYDLFYFYKDGKRIKAPKGAKYTSADKSIVAVERINGGTASFRGKKIGKTTITCTYKGSKASITIVVKQVALHVAGNRTFYLTVGSSAYIDPEVSDSKNIGKLELVNGDNTIASISQKTIEPNIYSNSSMAYYSSVDVKAKKVGTTEVKVRSKAGTDKIKIVVIPRLKVQVTNISKTETAKTYHFSYKITNRCSEQITVGGPANVLFDGEVYSAQMNEKAKVLAKSESATFTFDIPKTFEYLEDEPSLYYIRYKECTFFTYPEEKGVCKEFTFVGKRPMVTGISEYYL